MPFVFIHWWESKTDAQKAKVAKRVTDALVDVLVETGMRHRDAREQIEIAFNDMKRSDWWYGGVMGTPFYMQRDNSGKARKK